MSIPMSTLRSAHDVRPRRRRALAAALALALMAPVTVIIPGSRIALAADAGAATPAPVPGPAEVAIDNFTFGPNVLTVKTGTTVRWVNRDDIPHLVVDKGRKVFRSKVLDTDDSYSFTFDKPGTYDYFCGLHPHMTGQIVVTP